MGYPQGTTWVLEEGVWQPIFPGEAQGPGGANNVFADEGQEGAGSASSSQVPPQQQAAAAGSGGPRGGSQNHQQQYQQQPYLPRQAVARGAAPAATSQWNTGWSPTHQAPPQQAQPQQGRGYVVPAPGTWGYVATAAPSNGPWRPRYAPVYDPHTDPWHADEEDDPSLPAGTANRDEEYRHKGGSATYQANRLSAIQAQQAKPPHMLKPPVVDGETLLIAPRRSKQTRGCSGDMTHNKAPNNASNKQGGRNNTLLMIKSKITRKRLNSKKFATHKGDKTKMTSAKGERASATTMKAKEINAEEIRQRKVRFVQNSGNGGSTNPTTTRGIKSRTGWTWCPLKQRKKTAANPPQHNRGTPGGAKKTRVTGNDMKHENEAIYVKNAQPEIKYLAVGKIQRQRPMWGTRRQQNIENATKPDNRGTTDESSLQERPNNETQAEHSRGKDMEAIKPTQQGDSPGQKSDQDGVFNHFTYSWGGYSPPLTWPPELPLSGSTHLHLRRGEKEGFIPQGTAFELIPVGLVHRNLEPEQWVLRIRNLPSPDSRDPAGAPLHARKYLLTWNPRTMAWVLGDLTEEQEDKYRADAMARGPAVPDMSALAQDHELDHLSVSPERYADVRFARAKTQFPLEDPYQPRGGRKEELSQIALGTMPAMPPPPDRIYYAPSACQEEDAAMVQLSRADCQRNSNLQGESCHVGGQEQRNELSEVGELLEDVVADFGASIRLRDSAGIAEGRDALMEAVNTLDEIVMNYDAAHDEFTMDPATLQDDLLRLAQQLQIVVPAHNNLLGDIRGELPSQRPSSNAQELYEGYGDELGLMQQVGGGSSTTCPSNVATHVSINYFVDSIVLDPTRRGTQRKDTDALSNSYPSSSANSPKATAVTDNAKRMQYGCSFAGSDWQNTSTACLRGLYQHHEGNAREGARERSNRAPRRLRAHRPDANFVEREIDAKGAAFTANKGHYVHLYLNYDHNAARGQPHGQRGPQNTEEKQEPVSKGSKCTRGQEQQTPSPIHRARSQASQLMASIASETQAAAEYAPNAEELGGQQREAAAAEALDLITEAMGMANDVGMPGVVDYLSA
ncbi:TTLL6, partial [Symbiodinium sp. KB8]